jgi:hypothetical protein
MTSLSIDKLSRGVAIITLLISAAIALSAAPSTAKADIAWTVNGAFNDGSTVTGYFDIDVYGYLDGYNLQTTTGDLPGFDYTPADSYYSNGTFFIDAQPQYQNDLHLEFADSLSVPTADNPIIGGSTDASWECQGSFSCYLPADGATRFIAEGFASAAPEAPTWMMMLIGFGGIGAAMRRARWKQVVALAV